MVCVALPAAERAEQDVAGRHTAHRPTAGHAPAWATGAGWRGTDAGAPSGGSLTGLLHRYVLPTRLSRRLAARRESGRIDYRIGHLPRGRTDRRRPPAGGRRSRRAPRLAARRRHLRRGPRGPRCPGRGRRRTPVGAGHRATGSPPCGSGPGAGCSGAGRPRPARRPTCTTRSSCSGPRSPAVPAPTRSRTAVPSPASPPQSGRRPFSRGLPMTAVPLLPRPRHPVAEPPVGTAAAEPPCWSPAPAARPGSRWSAG